MTNDPLLLQYINGMVYGDPGVGKTHWAATAVGSDMDEVLFINIEGGLQTIRNFKKLPRVEHIGVGDPNSKIEAVSKLEEVIWKVISKAPGFGDIRTVVIDSVSELQNRDLEDVVEDAKKDIDDIGQDEYRKSTYRMRKVMRLARDAPFHLILTGLTKTARDRKTQEVVGMGPALTRALGESIIGFMDFVWYMYEDPQTKERCFLTRKKGPVYAKTRDDRDNPAFPEILRGATLPQVHTAFKTPKGEK